MSSSSGTNLQDLTAGGYQPPNCTQFSCFLDNRIGKLGEFLGRLDCSGLVLAAMSIVDSTDHAVARIVTSNGELAGRVLRRNNVPFSEISVLVVELSPEQTLRRMCSQLMSAELSIHYAYPLLIQPRNHPAVVIHTDDEILAGQILRRKLFTLLGENDLGDNATGSDPLDPDVGGEL